MKKYLLLFSLVLYSAVTSAQQDPMYSMYMFNHMAINPAYAGTHDHMQVTGLFRRQWLDFPGSPQTASFTLHSPLKNEKVGLGMSLINDQVGDMKTIAFMGAYSYQVRFKKSSLSLGLQAGFRNFALNLNDIQLSPDETSQDAAFQGNISQWSLNFGAGAFWYGENWYVSLGIPNMRNNIISAQQFNTTYVARYATHFNLGAGYVAKLSPAFKLKPSFLLKSVSGAPAQFDLNANLYWLDLLGFGVSYRSGDAMVFLMEVQLNRNFRLGYAYDQTVSALSGSVGGSHEIMLRADLGFNKTKTLTPRYF
jgi:type IX secretion system PorP/SprF family membrane protein